MRRPNTSRRGFLKGAALGAAAVVANPILSLRRVAGAAEGISGRFMVVINMLGGNDSINMVVPAHLTPYVERRPQINLVENSPVPLLDLPGTQFKLHPSMPNIKSLWDAGDVHIVDKVSYPTPNQSHFTSQDVMSYGVRDVENNGDGRGWLGRFADLYCADPVEPLGVISVGLGRRVDFDSNVTSPLVIGAARAPASPVSVFSVDSSEDLKGGEHDLRESIVRSRLEDGTPPLTEPALTLFNSNNLAYGLVERIQEHTQDWVETVTYPDTTLGRFLRAISQLLQGRTEFGTKVFYTGYGGFDTHSDQRDRHASLLRQLDDAVGAFQTDLSGRSMWDDCVIVVISEFGRRVFENGSTGTDHGHGGAFLVMGDRVKGGSITSEVVEADIETNNMLPFGVDFRDIYSQIVSGHIGVDGPALFPDPGYTPDLAGLNIY